MVTQTYEVYLRVEFTSERSEQVISFFHQKINFMCSNQRVKMSFYYIDECLENKKKPR